MAIFDQLSTSDFSSTDLAIYHFLMSNYEDASKMRVRDIAKASHTSAASVMRFVRKLGFNSYPEFIGFLKQSIHEKSDTGEIEFREEVIESLQENQFSFDMQEKLLVLADKIMDADQIVFIGIGISGILCEYAARRLATLGINSFAITDPYYPLALRLHNTTDNLLITISNSGQTPDLIEMMAYYQPLQDFQMVSITGNSDSSLARMSNLVFSHHYTKPRKYGFFDNSTQIPTMFIIESILNILEKHPEITNLDPVDF